MYLVLDGRWIEADPENGTARWAECDGADGTDGGDPRWCRNRPVAWHDGMLLCLAHAQAVPRRERDWEWSPALGFGVPIGH